MHSRKKIIENEHLPDEVVNETRGKTKVNKFANEVADKQGEYLEKHILPFLENNYPDNFNDIKQLFEKHKMIERKYIRDFFMKKYNHIVSAKELYKELLASNNCYAKATAPGGKKCFLFNK